MNNRNKQNTTKNRLATHQETCDFLDHVKKPKDTNRKPNRTKTIFEAATSGGTSVPTSRPDLMLSYSVCRVSSVFMNRGFRTTVAPLPPPPLRTIHDAWVALPIRLRLILVTPQSWQRATHSSWRDLNSY